MQSRAAGSRNDNNYSTEELLRALRDGCINKVVFKSGGSQFVWSLPAANEPFTDVMVQAVADGIRPRDEVSAPPPETNEAGEKLIYMVRATKLAEPSKSTRSDWVYHGRPFNTNESEQEILPTEWLNQNHMRAKWRKDRLLARPKKWFRVAVLSTSKQSAIHTCPTAPHKRPPQESIPTPPTSKRRHRHAVLCIPGALLKFAACAQFTDHVKKMEQIAYQSLSMGKVAACFRKVGNFSDHTSVTSLSDDAIYNFPPHQLYLVQLSGKSKHGRKDNTHCVAIFKKLIFDSNHRKPLALTKANLDACILGGDAWVFNNASRTIRFTLSKRALKRAIKSIDEKCNSYKVFKDL